MLGWFKKKFGKKDADTPQDPADLKIPVAPRPAPPQVLEDDAEAPQEKFIPSPEGYTAEPAESVSTGEISDVPSAEEDESNISPADELGTEEIENLETIEFEQEPPPGAAEPTVALSEPEEVAETARQEESLELTVNATEITFEETGVKESPEPPVTISAIEEDVLESSSPEPVIDEEVIETLSPEPALDIEVTEEEVTAEVSDLDKEMDEPEGPSLIMEAETEEEAAVVSPQEVSAAALVEEKKIAQKKKSFLTRLAERLSRTRETFTYQLDTLFLGKKEIDAKLLDDLEELLITADLGLNVTQEVLDHARRKLKRKELSDPNSLKLALKEKLKSFILDYQEDATLVMPKEGPFVIMVVGVNGVGKTTTIGKIAHKFLRADQSVLLVAADTFRAAAVSQLKIWGERNNIQVISKEEGADPSAVVYDGIAHAKAKGYDVVLVDTAGRLHTQANLMEELKKIKRVMAKQLEGAPHEVMLVIDATTGQNGISQAKLFNEAVTLSGITLTKLDGTAKGGIVINICRELKLPIRFIGVGEQLDDLRDFDPDEFIEALFHSADATQQ